MPVKKEISHPNADRPYMPGYGIMFRKNRKPVSWLWASKQLGKSRNYWLATVSPEGRPHVMPVWGLWLDNMFYFSTGDRSRKARNIALNHNCVVCAERIEEAVIMEGVVEKARSISASILKAYEKKYDWKLDGKEGSIYVVRPRTIFGVIEIGSSNPTRWSFKAKASH